MNKKEYNIIEEMKKLQRGSEKTKPSVPYMAILTAILLLLKVFGVVNISWVVVFCPIWVPVAIVVGLVVLVWVLMGVGLLVISALEFFFDKH